MPAERRIAQDFLRLLADGRNDSAFALYSAELGNPRIRGALPPVGALLRGARLDSMRIIGFSFASHDSAGGTVRRPDFGFEIPTTTPPWINASVATRSSNDRIEIVGFGGSPVNGPRKSHQRLRSRRRPVKKAGTHLETVRRLFRALPGVEEGPCFGTPGFRVRRRFLARLWEDGETLVVKCGDIERDSRMEADPDTFYITDHHRGYPTVLIHLDRVSLHDLRAVLEQAWRLNAPKRLLAGYDGTVARRGTRGERFMRGGQR